VIIYVQLEKALHGTLQAVILFWKLLSNTLKEWDSKIKNYDRCILNKIINGKKCTMIWHVNNLKRSHTEQVYVENILKTYR